VGERIRNTLLRAMSRSRNRAPVLARMTLARLAAGFGSHRPAVSQGPAEERPDYTREDVVRQLEGDRSFAMLTGNVIVLPVVYFVLNLAAAAFESCVKECLFALVYGAATSGNHFTFLSPIIQISDSLRVITKFPDSVQLDPERGEFDSIDYIENVFCIRILADECKGQMQICGRRIVSFDPALLHLMQRLVDGLSDLIRQCDGNK